MTPRTPQCEVFWSSKSSSEFSGVPEDSNPNFFQVLGFTPTFGQSRVATQFDSRPLKVKNRPKSDVYRRSATWRWKALKESYKISLDLIPIQGLSKKLWMPKVLGVETGTISGLLLGSPGKKCHSDVASAESCREYYMGKVVASPKFGLW
jgi:hypothetical protein